MRRNWKEQTTVKCPHCGKTVQARVPRRGDGSTVRPYQHKTNTGDICVGSYDAQVQP